MKQTPEQRSDARFPGLKTGIDRDMFHLIDGSRKGYLACIRELVEPKEAEIERLQHKSEVFDQLDAYGCSSAKVWLDKCNEVERLRALVQVLVDAVNTSQDVIFKMTDGPSFARWGPQLDINDSVMSTAKQAGFVPTNTEDHG